MKMKGSSMKNIFQDLMFFPLLGCSINIGQSVFCASSSLRRRALRA